MGGVGVGVRVGVGVGVGAIVGDRVEDGEGLAVGVGVNVGSAVGEVEGINSGVLVGEVGVGKGEDVTSGITILSPNIQPNPTVLATRTIIIKATLA